MIYIKKGKHYPTPFQFPKFYWNPTGIIMEGDFIFSAGCNYHIDGEDMHDINKLFGISFGWHHKYSERIGWRYREDLDKIEILTYTYIDGQRHNFNMAFVTKCQRFNVRIEIIKKNNTIYTSYFFNNTEVKQIKYSQPKSLLSKLSYTLGIYFGGNKPAPESMLIFGGAKTYKR
jgi:hypothetical protein